jgi:hypothetical protein
MAPTSEIPSLLTRLRAFCFPGGEEFARRVTGVETTQRGEMRMSPGGKWIPFTARETTDARRSNFRWEARYQGGARGWITVTDAYEDGHGWLALKLGGVIPVKKATGPAFDKGELQRYLASVMICPPILLNHKSLEWIAVDSHTLRVHDRDDPTGASINIEVSVDGRPGRCHATRPMAVRKQITETPWSGTCQEFREWEGCRVASRIEASWDLPEGPFCYYRSELTSYKLLN